MGVLQRLMMIPAAQHSGFGLSQQSFTLSLHCKTASARVPTLLHGVSFTRLFRSVFLARVCVWGSFVRTMTFLHVGWSVCHQLYAPLCPCYACVFRECEHYSHSNICPSDRMWVTHNYATGIGPLDWSMLRWPIHKPTLYCTTSVGHHVGPIQEGWEWADEEQKFPSEMIAQVLGSVIWEQREFFNYATPLVIVLSLYMFQFTMLFTIWRIYNEDIMTSGVALLIRLSLTLETSLELACVHPARSFDRECVLFTTSNLNQYR